MITWLLLAQILAGPASPTPPGDLAIPELRGSAVLQRYAAALKKVRDPRVLTFDYALNQTGMRTLEQTHRVYRSGGDERDETLLVDGVRLTPPKVRVFRNRRNRYTILSLAPRPAEYDFVFVGPRRNAHHFDYVFRLEAKAPHPFAITEITIDGVRFLPSSIAFTTWSNDGSGTIYFGRSAAWWVPYFASARATVADTTSTEKLSFFTYRFPPALPTSTFSQGRRLPSPTAIPVRAPATLTPTTLVPQKPATGVPQ